MTEPAPKQHGQVIGLVAIATMALPRAAALCTCAAHARHPSTSCLSQQQAVDVFLHKKKEKETAWLCHRTSAWSSSQPPAFPSVRHSCIRNWETKRRVLSAATISASSPYASTTTILLLNAKCFFSSVLLRHCTVHCKDCRVHCQDTGAFLASAFEVLRFFTGQRWHFFLTWEWTFLTAEKPWRM